MNNTFKDYFTTSVSDDKTFSKVKQFQTYYKDDETGRWIPKFRNTYEVEMNASNYGQVGIGINHKCRGAFVIDCDATLSAEYIYEICCRYFVEPSAILTTPKNHTQTFFFFDKDIIVYRGDIPTKKHRLYMDHSHKLNKWLGIGDENFTGYWAKNPFSDKWTCNYNTSKTYPFETLCFLIDELPENIDYEPRFTDKTSVSTEDLAKLALDFDVNDNEDGVIDEFGVRHKIELIEKYKINPEKNEVEYVTETEIIEDEDIISEVEAKLAKTNERRGKFKTGSENRHSFLFRVILANRNQPIEYIKELVKVYNRMFDVPLTETELNKEVLNHTTLTKTLGQCKRWDSCRKEAKELESDYIIETYWNNNKDVDATVSEIVCSQASLHTALRLVKEYFPEYDATELEKKYNKEYLGKYKGKYDNTSYVKENKMKCKVRKWLKKNGNNKEYPKKWNKEEIELANKMKSALLSF